MQNRFAHGLLIVLTLSLAAGCQHRSPSDSGSSGIGGGGLDGDSGVGTGQADSGSAGPSDSTAGTGSGSNPGSGQEADGGSGVLLDVGGGDAPLGPGCHKIDFLFVIDNSSSMGDNQANLIQSFPGFISAIESTVSAHDYHVMVVDSDASVASCDCNGDLCFDPTPATQDCCDDCNGFFGGSGCDIELGAGRTKSQKTGQQCDFVAGDAFMTSADDLHSTFSCAANVGTSGSPNELPMTAMLRALRADVNAAGACNEGFLRDDAILVVTVVSDASHDTANIEDGLGDAQQWHDDLVARKGGNEDAIVVIGMFGDADVGGGLCGGDQAGPKYRQFVEAFGSRGFLGSVCSPDYSELFAQAISTIDLTCDEFTPEG
jgi:hypothetical protein